MEAMSLGYPPEQKGQISVTATKEEWSEILEFLDCGTFGSHESYLKATELKEKLAGWGIG